MLKLVLLILVLHVALLSCRDTTTDAEGNDSSGDQIKELSTRVENLDLDPSLYGKATAEEKVALGNCLEERIGVRELSDLIGEGDGPLPSELAAHLDCAITLGIESKVVASDITGRQDSPTAEQ